jgi:hypothetical protein
MFFSSFLAGINTDIKGSTVDSFFLFANIGAVNKLKAEIRVLTATIIKAR